MFDKKAFIEELIQLQLKHEVILEGYDIEFWTKEQGDTHAAKYPRSAEDVLVNEANIRDRWEHK